MPCVRIIADMSVVYIPQHGQFAMADAHKPQYELEIEIPWISFSPLRWTRASINKMRFLPVESKNTNFHRFSAR